jgi:regulator of sigma E protease
MGAPRDQGVYRMIPLMARFALTIFCLGLVVVIHELGHLVVALWLGVRVERFTVGFGQELFGWTSRNIRYSVCAIPLGGMVKLAGEFQDERQNKPDEFFSQPWYRRNLIALAGPVMNYVLAFIIFAVVAGVWGILQPSPLPIVGAVIPGFPAAQAKLQENDRILDINGQSVATWDEMARFIHEHPEQKLSVNVERPGADGQAPQKVKLTLTPKLDPQQGMGLIGIMPRVDKVNPGFKGSFRAAAQDVKVWTVQPLQYLSTKLRHFEGPKELSGPLGIAQMVSKATKEGLSYVLYLIAIISTGLGLFNLFPIPILDGGHILLYTIEGILGRPLGKRTLQVAHAIGLSLVLTIFLYASFQDVMRWRLGFWK